VNLVTTLYRRFRHLIHEGAKFCVIGGVGAVVTLGGADMLRFDAGLGKYTALTVSTLIATVVTFLGNRYWTFRHRSGKGTTHETVMFFVLNGVGLLIGYACIGLIQGAMGLDGRIWYNVANLMGLVLGTVFRFWSYRKWVWHAVPAGALPEARFTEPAVAYAETYRDEPTVHLGLGARSHEAREPELVPPPWNSAPAAVQPRSSAAGIQRPDGPRHAR
jgi:putative flippase GtrA